MHWLEGVLLILWVPQLVVLKDFSALLFAVSLKIVESMS